MHEMSLMSNILSTADKMLTAYHVKYVTEVEVSAGILANILPDALEFAFSALSDGTVYNGAHLTLLMRPLSAVCTVCGEEYESNEVPPTCPQCGSTAAKIISGSEVLLTAIDFEEEQP